MKSEDEKASTALNLDAMKKLSRRGVMNKCRSIP
jgi:hypothetical protein